MSSIFGSKNDPSAQRAAADAADGEEETRMVKAYYQKAGEPETTSHKPKVVGKRAKVKDKGRADKPAGPQ
jgi:hypothetical protein